MGKGGAAEVHRFRGYVLRVEAEARVRELISRHPGIGLAELARQSGVNRTAARGHVENLKRAGVVHEERVARRVRFVPADRPKEAPRTILAREAGYWLFEDDAKRIREAIRTHPGAHLRALLRATGLPHQRLRAHLESMKEAGTVVERGRGRERTFGLPGASPLAQVQTLLASRPWLERLLQEMDPIERENGVRRPGVPQKIAIARAASRGAPRSTTQHQLGALVRHGLLERVDEGRGVRYRLTDLAASWRAQTKGAP
ncbi:MAG: hypothetical protein ACYDBQ_12130 [Thermoplasmatota archaeon]